MLCLSCSSAPVCCSPAAKCHAGSEGVASGKRGFSYYLIPFSPRLRSEGCVCALLVFPPLLPPSLSPPTLDSLAPRRVRLRRGGPSPKEGALHHGCGHKPRAPATAAASHNSHFSMGNEANTAPPSPHPHPQSISSTLHIKSRSTSSTTSPTGYSLQSLSTHLKSSSLSSALNVISTTYSLIA